MKAKLILSAVFFSICFGLGYAPLNRYDPASVLGLSDARSYVAMVDGRPDASPKHSVRVLVPLLARTIARVAAGRTGSWNPALFALLVVNSAFVAWAAVLLLAIGELITGDRRVGLIASLIYLLTFNVINFQLAGLVDSVEAWALIAVTWALLARRWLLVPLIGIVGALGKETSVPLVLVFCIAWVGTLAVTRSKERPPYWTIVALLLAQIVAVESVHISITGLIAAPWKLASSDIRLSYAGQNFPAMAMVRELFYSFVWLLPLGIPRLKDLPREWIISSAAALLVVLGLTLGVSVGENATRPAFNVLGPIL
ncbi:MAG: hypothetical protein ABI875_09585, partial [Gemmatimonadales bacterium]